MTILTACQSAAVRLLGRRPTTFFSATTQFEVEICELATEAATAIAKAHDWRALTKLNTITGDGSSTAFNMPSDYDRMPKTGDVHSSTFQTATFRRAESLDEWLNLNDTQFSATPGNWIILGGQMHIFPAPSASETARFYYISDKIVAETAAPTVGAKAAFTTDTDVFLLSERLLTLALIWRWRAQKRMEYAEDMQNFEIAMGEEALRDKGSRVLTVGVQRNALDLRRSYPRALG